MTKARFDVTTIGEGSLRLSVPAGDQLERATNLNLAISGTEGNVVGALGNLGWKTAWFSKLPKTALGKRVLNEYRLAAIDTSEVVWAENERLATVFVEYAVTPRLTNVVFDRNLSAFSQMTAQDVNWDYLLDTQLIHLTGITASLSDSLQTILTELVKRASQKGIKLSFDVNYREKLWSTEQAHKVLLPLVKASDLLFCSQADAEKVFGCTGSPEDKLLQLSKQTQAQHIVMSCGSEGVIAWDGQHVLSQPAKDVDIIDRIGAGDGLPAGVIHGYLKTDFSGRKDFDVALEYGCTMAALAMSQFGELISCSAEHLDSYLKGPKNDISR